MGPGFGLQPSNTLLFSGLPQLCLLPSGPMPYCLLCAVPLWGKGAATPFLSPVDTQHVAHCP